MAVARVAPTKMDGAGIDTATPVWPTGPWKPGAPSAPAPHQLQLLQLVTVTVEPVLRPLDGLRLAVGVAGVGSSA